MNVSDNPHNKHKTVCIDTSSCAMQGSTAVTFTSTPSVKNGEVGISTSSTLASSNCSSAVKTDSVDINSSGDEIIKQFFSEKKKLKSSKKKKEVKGYASKPW